MIGDVKKRICLTLQTHKTFDIVCKQPGKESFYNNIEAEKFPSMYGDKIKNKLESELQKQRSTIKFNRLFDDIHLHWLKGLFAIPESEEEILKKYDASYYEFGHSFKKLLVEIYDILKIGSEDDNSEKAGLCFNKLFFENGFINSFLKSFWRNTIVFDKKKTELNIVILATVKIRETEKENFKQLFNDNQLQLGIDMFEPCNIDDKENIKKDFNMLYQYLQDENDASTFIENKLDFIKRKKIDLINLTLEV